MNIDKLEGLVFITDSGKEFGTIRNFSGTMPNSPCSIATWKPLAEDDCGNIFAISEKNEIAFWDHETDEITILSKSYEDFQKNCAKPKKIKLEDGQVISVWSDPSFKPEFD